MSANDIYNDGNAPKNGQQIGVTLNKILGSVNESGGGGVAWGAITGTLSAQTDLQSALDARAATANNLSDLANFASSRDTLGISTYDNGQFYSVIRVSNWSTTSAAPLRMLIWGDSLASGLDIGRNMARQGSTMGLATTTGTVTQVTGATSVWVNGRYTSHASGSTAQFTSGLTNDPAFDRVQILYIAESGAGTVSVDYSGNAGSSWTNISSFSAANATTIGASQTLAVASDYTRPRRRIRLSVSVGTVKIIGVICYNNDGVGVITINNLFNGVGHDAVEELNTPNAILQPIWTALAVDCALVCWADEASTYETGGGFRQMYDKLTGWRAASDFIFVAPNPAGVDQMGVDDPTDSIRIASTAAMFAFAREKGQSFFDGHSLFRSYAEAAAAGFYNHPTDKVHLLACGTFYRNYALWSAMSLGQMSIGASVIAGGPTIWTTLEQSAKNLGITMTSGTLSGAQIILPRTITVRQQGNEDNTTAGVAWGDCLSTFAGNDTYLWRWWASNAIASLSAFSTNYLSIDANGSGYGGGTKRLFTGFPICAQGFRDTTPTTVTTITADNQAVVVTDLGLLRLSSDSTTATDRTFTLGNGLQGQILRLIWTHATNRAELTAASNCKLTATWSPVRWESLYLFWSSADSAWIEIARTKAIVSSTGSASYTAVVGINTFTGSTAAQTVTLPAPAPASNVPIFFKNQSSVSVTLASASGSQIFTTSAQASITVIAGDSVTLWSDGTYWNQ